MKRLLLVLMFLALSALPAFAQNFDFPNSPTANQIISGPAGQAMKWDGTKWVAQFGTVGGPFLPEAPLDGNSYLRTNGAWTSGGTLANDLTGSAVHLTNLSGWAPLNFGQPSLAAGTDGAVVASLFAYNKGVGGNNNLNITAGAYMWNGNWNAATPTAEAIVMNPTSISLQFSTGNTVGSTFNTWNTVAVFDSTGLNVQQGGLQLGGTQPQGPYVLFQPKGQPNPWAALSSGADSNLNISAGGHFNGSTWIADSATYHDISLQSVAGSTGFNFYENTGLTVGASFSPSQIGQWGSQQGWNNGLHLGLSAQQVYSCYNSYPNIPNNAQVVIMHSGIWGASSAGFLTVYNTYSGAVTMTNYSISSFGSPAANSIAQLITNDYGGGGAHFTVTQVGAVDGSSNPYLQFVLTNTSGQTSSFYYWYLQTGGGSTMYCQ